MIIGIESSDLFGCSELNGKPQCARGDIVRGIREYKRLGVRGMFVAHWVNNAFAGAALESGDKGVFINILNRFQTGSYFTTGGCPGTAACRSCRSRRACWWRCPGSSRRQSRSPDRGCRRTRRGFGATPEG